jgi:hypothetical protein
MGKFSRTWRRTMKRIRLLPKKLACKWRSRHRSGFLIMENRGDPPGPSSGRVSGQP